jgi:DNA-binding LytR/AlgR family response regulator
MLTGDPLPTTRGSITVKLELMNALPEEPTSYAAHYAPEPNRESPQLVMPARVENIRNIWPRSERTGSAKPVRVGIRTNRKIQFLDCAEILALEAEGNYVLVRHFKASYISRERISELADRLQAYGFLRVHRSVLVNIVHVTSLEPLANGDCRLHMRGGSSYSVGRSYKKNLRRMAELWVGM